MPVHDAIQAMLPACVLGALEAGEAARVKAHLASCAKCSRVLEEYRPVAESLVFAVRRVELPRGLKTRTMQRAMRPEAGEETRSNVVPRPSWRPRLGFGTALAGAALVIVLLGFAWNAWQIWQLNQQLTTLRDLITAIAYDHGGARIVRGTGLAPEALGRLYTDPDAKVAALVTVDMPALNPHQVYQVWLTDPAGHQVSGGTFSIDNDGNGWLLVNAPSRFDGYAQVGVTTEPRGGSLSPTTEPILSAKLTTP